MNIVDYVCLYLDTFTSGDISVEECNLNKLHGKRTFYYASGKIVNQLWNDNKKIAFATVKEDQAFFTRDGEVKTALDKDTYLNNLGGWMVKGGLADDDA